MFADQLLHLQGGFENRAVLTLTEPDRRKFIPPIHHRVVMHREALHIPTPLTVFPPLHNYLSPISESWFVAAWSHCNLEHLLIAPLFRIEVPDEARKNPKLTQIVIS